MQRSAGGRRGLRVRVAAAFAAGGLVLSVTLAVVTYVLSDQYLTDQRERSAQRQAFLYARFIRDDLRRGADEAFSLLSLDLPTGSSVLLHRGGQWYASPADTPRMVLPTALRRAIARGGAAHQRIAVAGEPMLAVGVPVPAIRAEMYQMFQLVELDNTLGVVASTLLGAAGVTTVGAALLGIWAGRRVLRPLADVGRAAHRIAAGDLGARIEVGDDPDLADLAESFNAMVGALEMRLERDARFASDVSHELRSPLTTIKSASSVLERRRDELSPRGREALDLLSLEVQRFERLVEELLELARAESQTELLDLEVVRLGDLVEHAIGDRPGVAIEISAAVSSETVLTDKRRLDRVLANLLQNADSHGGGVTRVSVARVDGTLRVEVDDAGPGVGVEHREQIFDRFYRGPAAGRRDDSHGTGLGLALVAEHVRVLGGTCWAEDRPTANGARFVVEIPLRSS